MKVLLDQRSQSRVKFMFPFLIAIVGCTIWIFKHASTRQVCVQFSALTPLAAGNANVCTVAPAVPAHDARAQVDDKQTFQLWAGIMKIITGVQSRVADRTKWNAARQLIIQSSQLVVAVYKFSLD